MFIYKITRKGPQWRDELLGAVVIAENAAEARISAATACGDEGSTVWLRKATVELIGEVPGPARLVLTDFFAG